MGFYLTEWANCERMAVSLTKNKATAQPCRVLSAFFMPVKFPHPQKVLVSFISYFVAKYYAEKSTYSKYFLTEGTDYHKFELKTIYNSHY